MGGLRKKIPWTFWTMLVATLAIAGTPGFSGFFSKDEICLQRQRASTPLWALGVLTAGLTSFYMFRLLFLTFFGAQRFDENMFTCMNRRETCWRRWSCLRFWPWVEDGWPRRISGAARISSSSTSAPCVLNCP